MRKLIKSNNIKYFIGDVRDLESVNNAMFGSDYVFMLQHLNKCLLVSFIH